MVKQSSIVGESPSFTTTFFTKKKKTKCIICDRLSINNRWNFPNIIPITPQEPGIGRKWKIEWELIAFPFEIVDKQTMGKRLVPFLSN